MVKNRECMVKVKQQQNAVILPCFYPCRSYTEWVVYFNVILTPDCQDVKTIVGSALSAKSETLSITG